MQNPSQSTCLVENIISISEEKETVTDILIREGSVPLIKTPEGWREYGKTEICRRDIESFLSEYSMVHDWRAQMENAVAVDFPASISNMRLRCNLYKTDGGRTFNLAVRVLPLLAKTIAELGLKGKIESTLAVGKGLILVTGPTGSGKTTTIASMVRAISEASSVHIITIEEPIEYTHRDGKGVVSQKEVGRDVLSFSTGLREALRQKPDVIVIGEIRDAETAATAIHASESGHLVIASMHTNSAVGAISKLIMLTNQDQREARASAIASSMVAVIGQVLVPSVKGDELLLCTEILYNKPQVAKFIADQNLHGLADLIRKTDIPQMRSLNRSLVDRLIKKEITHEAALKATNNPVELRAAIDNGYRVASA